MIKNELDERATGFYAGYLRLKRKREAMSTLPKDRTGAANHRGTSVQSVGTPRDLLDAVERRFGRITFDLAADADNCVVQNPSGGKCWFDEADDALSPETQWPNHGTLWLNPPFADIAPWATRCGLWTRAALNLPQPDAVLLMLVPASVGANYWERSIAGKARVLGISPRVRFAGHTQAFPKDLALCVYDPRFPAQPALVEPWRYK